MHGHHHCQTTCTKSQLTTIQEWSFRLKTPQKPENVQVLTSEQQLQRPVFQGPVLPGFPV